MTKEKLAKELNGREYLDEISDLESKTAKDAGLIVIFGYFDDCIEIRGAISDELSAYGGKVFYMNREKAFPVEHRCECEFCGFEDAAAKSASVEALWAAENGYSWTFKTAIPHATFEIVEDGNPFCRGIVFSVEDLPK